MVAASGRDGFPDGVGEFVDQAAAGGQFLPQLPASAVAGCLEVFEADAGPRPVPGHRHAQERAVVEHPPDPALLPD